MEIDILRAAVRSGSAGIPSWRHRVGFRLKWRDSAGLGGEGGCSGVELSGAEWGWVLATVGNDRRTTGTFGPFTKIVINSSDQLGINLECDGIE